MLASLSIRAKITIVLSFLLIAMTGMGLFAVRKMQAINANTVDIQTSWLPSVRVLGELRATTIDYRNLIREHMLSETAEQMANTEKGIEKISLRAAGHRERYEKLITSPRSAPSITSGRSNGMAI
ncbi:Na+-transporting methylmalonyl-CoA/oxaloacetate decarboxylase gamma subunit [Nitrobacteraceae bacterium AZCC 2161]